MYENFFEAFGGEVEKNPTIAPGIDLDYPSVSLQVCGDADCTGVLSRRRSGVGRVRRRRGEPGSARRVQSLRQM